MVSSIGGYQPMPGMAIYAATKTFVSRLADGIGHELYDSNVEVSCFCPSFVRTKMIETVFDKENLVQ